MQTQQLSKITTAVSNVTARIYTPGYTTSLYSQRLLMTSLQECAVNLTTCHPATNFTYNSGTQNLTFSSLQSSLPTSGGILPGSVTPIADLDGDGTREIAINGYEQDNDSLHLYLEQIAADGTAHSVVDLTGTPFVDSPTSYADIDGDGRSELFWGPSYSQGSGFLSIGVWKGARGGIATSASSPTASFNALFATVPTNIPLNAGDQVFAYDMNGDGKLDIVVVTYDAACRSSIGNGQGVFVYLNNLTTALPTDGSKVNFTSAGLLFCLQDTWTNDPVAGVINETVQRVDHIADFNGDGIPDVFLTATTFPSGQESDDPYHQVSLAGVYLIHPSADLKSLTASWTQCSDMGIQSNDCIISTQGSSTIASFSGVFRWMDVNGDGLDDLVTAWPGGNWRVHLNQGGGKLADAIDTGSNEGLDLSGSGGNGFRYANSSPMMDIDGDGIPELLAPRKSTKTGNSITTGFAMRMCSAVEVDPLADGCPGGAFQTNNALVTPNSTGLAQCMAYSCPEEPGLYDSNGRAVLNMPTNTDTVNGYPSAWTTEQPTAVAPVAPMYTSNIGKINSGVDYSAYHMDSLKFVQNITGSSVGFTVIRSQTSLITTLNSGYRGGVANDISGNGLASLLTPIGCQGHYITINATSPNPSYLAALRCR